MKRGVKENFILFSSWHDPELSDWKEKEGKEEEEEEDEEEGKEKDEAGVEGRDDEGENALISGAVATLSKNESVNSEVSSWNNY